MGYAADPMQERRSALTTGIILGLVWAIWHFVPLIQMGRTLTWIAWWTLSAAKEDYKQWVAKQLAASSDLHFSIEELVAEGAEVVTRLIGSGTHDQKSFG